MKNYYLRNNKKIIYIIDNLLIGGAQIHLLRLAKELNSKGFSVEIIYLGRKEEGITKDINLPTYNIKMDCIWKLHFWNNFFTLIKLIAEKKPAIIHTYLNTSNVFGVFAARLAGVSIVISSRRDLGYFRSKIIGSLEKISARLSDKIVCVSDAVKKKIIKEEKLSLNKIVTIYNGANINIFTDIHDKKDNDYFNISMVATMRGKKKGHSYFIEAAENIIKERKDVRFNLIGDGRLRPSLEYYVNSRGLIDYFNFRGKRNNLLEELKDTDIFVVPSETEACSNALLEAMAMGIPAIATAIDGNLEVIEDGVSGFLVKPKDPSAITDKISELLSSPEKMEKIGIEARKRIAKKFTHDEMARHYIELYEDLIKTKIRELNENNLLKIGYIVSLFPCWSEVFILNEIIELEKKGVEISIFSVRRDLEKFIQEKAKPYIKKTKYINIPRGIISTFLWCIRRPIIMSSLFTMVLSKKHNTHKELLKNIWCIFLGCFFADIALTKKLEHIHAHFATYPALTALIISKLTNIPFTFTAHAHDIFLNKPFLKELTEEAKEVVTISNYNKQYIADYCGNRVASKIKVVRCGVNLSNYEPILIRENNEQNTILSIGRLTEMKGFEYLIRACHKIKSSINFKCHIVGEGPLQKDLSRLVNELGLNENILFEGILDSGGIRKLLNKANLFVLPSVWSDKDGQEGIPVVLMEAMAAGVPVVASKISGIPELIEDGKTGLLVEPKNEQELSNKILDLINNKKLQEYFSANGRFKIKQEFDIAKNADLLLDIFKKERKILKVLFIIWSLEEGGAERFLVSLLKSMDRNRIEPVVCCLNWKGMWAHELEEKGIRVIELNKNPGVDFAAFLKLLKIIRKENFDIVNTYLWGADTMGRFAAFLAGTPIVISTAQNVDLWKKRWHRVTDKLLSYKTDMIIAVSDAVKNYYHRQIGIPLKKITTIPNAIEIGKFENIKDITYLYDELGVTSRDYILVCIGRLNQQKGQKYLLESIDILHYEFPNLRVLFVGYGEDKEKLVKLAKAIGVYDMVRFLGYREDIPQILNLSHGLVLPSVYEGLPLCILEAMAAAKPVIATNVTGMSELVMEQQTGFIVSPKNPEALALAIKNLINLPDKGKKMGEKGREIVMSNFSIHTIAQKTTDLFLSLIKTGR